MAGKKRQQQNRPPLSRVQLLAEDPRLLLDNAGPSTRTEQITKHVIENIVSKHGNSAEYLTARIARDHPGILERMRKGEFKSIWQAATAAGIVKRKTPLDKLRLAWQQASTAERKAFLAEVSSLRRKE